MAGKDGKKKGLTNLGCTEFPGDLHTLLNAEAMLRGITQRELQIKIFESFLRPTAGRKLEAIVAKTKVGDKILAAKKS